jgi:hypothetical protein
MSPQEYVQYVKETVAALVQSVAVEVEGSVLSLSEFEDQMERGLEAH